MLKSLPPKVSITLFIMNKNSDWYYAANLNSIARIKLCVASTIQNVNTYVINTCACTSGFEFSWVVCLFIPGISCVYWYFLGFTFI